MENQGWRYFNCPECGFHWREATRYYKGLSCEYCPSCMQEVPPYMGHHDKTVKVNEFGNLKTYYEEKINEDSKSDKSDKSNHSDA